MVLARLTKVTVISPRAEYQEVARTLAEFEDFHPAAQGAPKFDPAVQELDVRAVKLFAQADQAVKDLGIQLMPGAIDIIFKGVKVPRDEFEAADWRELLADAEAKLAPVADEVKTERAALQKAAKDEQDALTLKDALKAVSGLSIDVGKVSHLERLKTIVAVVRTDGVDELRRSVPDSIFVAQKLNEADSLVLVSVMEADDERLEKTLKALEVRPLQIPAGLPQNPADAYKRLTEEAERARVEKEAVEKRLDDLRQRSERTILATRELTAVARDLLDEARASGEMNRFATISGYIPAKQEERFKALFERWMVYSEEVEGGEGHGGEVPTLLANPVGVRTFQLITGEQGTPGREEVDPTPLVSFVFPIFFGFMFGDVGHGIILTLVALLIRQRGTGSMRQWGNIFLAAGVSAIVFGALVGEFFGSALNLYQLLSPVTVHQIEILTHPLGVDTPNTAAIQTVMVLAILIGVAHLTTGLSLDVFEALRAGEKVEAVVGKIPTLTMYLSGVGYGIAFLGAGYSFDVLKSASPAPLLGIPNNELGAISLAILFPSMAVLFCGKAVAIKAGKLKGGSFAGALSDGGLEVFERISQFLSNTISYVRLAILLLVHAVLLLIVNRYFPLTDPVMIVPWVVLNCLIVAFEAFVVYVQDLRLHIYEFFTKFYRGTGTPFRKILPDRTRVAIKWRQAA